MYLTVPLAANATVGDCATACCGDWNCQTFAFTPAAPPDNRSLNGSWINHDSLRGDSGVTMQQDLDGAVSAWSSDPARAYWSAATGRMINASALFLVFDANPANNRTGIITNNGSTITFSRVSFDPANFTQVLQLPKEEEEGGRKRKEIIFSTPSAARL